MPFDHNDHYHRLLLRHVPAHARRGLDVGCGTGRFARALARRGLEVDAIDSSAEALHHARTVTHPPVHFRLGDITADGVPQQRYDVITCLASVHHVPFGTVTALREALVPGGALLILGCYRESGLGDAAVSLAAVGPNAAARAASAVGDRLRGSPRTTVAAPTAPPPMTLPEIREQARFLLPGCTVRRLLLWRYLLRFEASFRD